LLVNSSMLAVTIISPKAIDNDLLSDICQACVVMSVFIGLRLF